MNVNKRKVKAGITARGFMTAVKDYTEPAVVEELAANSFDADASTVLVLLDSDKQQLHIVDDGTGFTSQAIEIAAVLGGGDKRDVEYSFSKRPYLGAYGFGLKSTIKIANTVKIHSISSDGKFNLVIDWKRLEEALRSDSSGFELEERSIPKKVKTGTHILLDLKNPTADLLETYHQSLRNLPDDSGKCRYFTGLMPKIRQDINPALSDFGKLRSAARNLAKRKLITAVEPSKDPDLRQCQVNDTVDKQDRTVKCKIFFAGMDGDKVRPLKKGLRGIYVRIQGRLLKQSFDEQKYVYGISKWVKFAAGLRVELTIDWLRNEISLSRERLTFSNPKLEENFKSTIGRNVSAFIAPQLKVLERRAQRYSNKRHAQRLELAHQRSRATKSGHVYGITGSFNFKPETDGELALLIANEGVLKRINPSYRLIDYDDQAPFDCIVYDSSRRELVFCELEPTLIEFLQHKKIPNDLRLIIVWSLGKWRMGARKKGSRYNFQLTNLDPTKKGHYKILAYSGQNVKKPFADYEVVVLEELFSISK